MAGRGRASFQKRQKEQLRLERRQQKAARKEERKAHKGEPETEDLDVLTGPEATPGEDSGLGTDLAADLDSKQP